MQSFKEALLALEIDVNTAADADNEERPQAIKHLSKNLDTLYRNWNIYSRKLVQSVQASHSETLESWDSKLRNELIFQLLIAITSIIAVGLVYRQYLIQARLSARAVQTNISAH